MIGVIVFGPPTPLVVSLFGINPVSTILEHLNLVDDPYHRSFSDIVKLELFSLIVLGIGFYMFVRYLFVMLLLTVLSGVSGMAGLEMIIRKDKTKQFPEEDLARQYEMVLVVFTILKIFFAQFGLIFVVFTQLFLTILSWLSINCFGAVPMFVTLTASAAFVGGLAFSVSILAIYTNARVVSIYFVSRKRKESAGEFYGKWLKAKYVCRKWWSLQPIPIYGGSHFAFSKHAIINFFDVLSSNITNAVLLIFP